MSKLQMPGRSQALHGTRVKIVALGRDEAATIPMNQHLPQIRVVAQRCCSMAATLLLLRFVLGPEASAHPSLVAPQAAAGGAQNSAADSSGDATVSGTVRDQSGTALGRARVTLTDERSSAQRVVLTTENGAYVFTPVQAGTYTLAAELSGFENAVRQHLTVTDHQHLNVELSLAPKPSGSDGQAGDAHAASRAKGAGTDANLRAISITMTSLTTSRTTSLPQSPAATVPARTRTATT